MDIRNYTYELYLEIYDKCDGVTTHFVPTVGIKGWHKKKMARNEFEQKLTRLLEIESHDDDWLIKQPDYIDIAENDAWETLWLESELFIIELEKAEKIVGE